jgi:hypothetical protein
MAQCRYYGDTMEQQWRSADAAPGRCYITRCCMRHQHVTQHLAWPNRCDSAAHLGQGRQHNADSWNVLHLLSALVGGAQHAVGLHSTPADEVSVRAQLQSWLGILAMIGWPDDISVSSPSTHEALPDNPLDSRSALHWLNHALQHGMPHTAHCYLGWLAVLITAML